MEHERAAVTQYQQALAPVADAFYDQVQPLQQAFRDLADGDVPTVDPLLDLAAHVAGERGIGPLRQQLEAVAPAASLLREHQLLLTALDDHVSAAGQLGVLRDSAEVRIEADLIARADLALDAATRHWTGAVAVVFTGNPTPPIPAEAGVEGLRPARSSASYLRGVGNLCSLGLEALHLAGSDGSAPTAIQVRASATELSSRLPQLKAVPTATSDEPLVSSSIREPLDRARELVDGLNRGLRAMERGDQAALRSAQGQIARGEVAAHKAAAGLRAYGSELCAIYLVGVEDAAEPDPGRPTRSTSSGLHPRDPAVALT